MVSSPNLRVDSSFLKFKSKDQSTFRKTDDLLGVEPASQKLIEAIRNKGRTVEIVRPGTDEYRYMQAHGWEANVGEERLTHILVRKILAKLHCLKNFYTERRLKLVYLKGSL